MFRRIAEEYVLVPIHKEAVDLEALFSFNQTAARIWELLDGKTRGVQVAEVIAREFGCSQEQVNQDVQEFLEELYRLRFIQETEKQ